MRAFTAAAVQLAPVPGPLSPASVRKNLDTLAARGVRFVELSCITNSVGAGGAPNHRLAPGRRIPIDDSRGDHDPRPGGAVATCHRGLSVLVVCRRNGRGPHRERVRDPLRTCTVAQRAGTERPGSSHADPDVAADDRRPGRARGAGRRRMGTPAAERLPAGGRDPQRRGAWLSAAGDRQRLARAQAFQQLLADTGKPHGWMLVPKLTVRRGEGTYVSEKPPALPRASEAGARVVAGHTLSLDDPLARVQQLDGRTRAAASGGLGGHTAPRSRKPAVSAPQEPCPNH